MDQTSIITSPLRGHWRLKRNAAVFLAIALGHAGFASMLRFDPIEVHGVEAGAGTMITEIFLPEVELEGAEPSFTEFAAQVAITAPQLAFDVTEGSRLEAPRIDPDAVLMTAPFAERAQLVPGEVVTVLLLLQIAGDGAVISAKIVRSNGSESANAAALDYARATRWIPGSIDGEPRPMQASLTVILGES